MRTDRLTPDKDFVFMGKNCFPLTIESTRGFLIQVQRIALEQGFKYREEKIAKGLSGWFPGTVRPVICRRIFKQGENEIDLSNSTMDDVACFEDDYFIVNQGESYEKLKKELRDLYETFSIVREAEGEIERNREKLKEIESEERERRLKQTSLGTEEITKIIDQCVPYFREEVEKQNPSWSYQSCIENGAVSYRDTLFKGLDNVLEYMKRKIREKFEERADIKGLSDEFYTRWKREGERIIVSSGK